MRRFVARESDNGDRHEGVVVLALSGRALRGDAREGVGWVHRIKLGGPARMMELLRGFDVEDEGDWTIISIGLDADETYVLSTPYHEGDGIYGTRLVVDTDEPTDEEIGAALVQLGVQKIEGHDTTLHRMLSAAERAIGSRSVRGPARLDCHDGKVEVTPLEAIPPGCGGNVTFMSGCGGAEEPGGAPNHSYDGDIRFGTPGQGWMLELCHDGQVKVRGKVVDTDIEVVEGFKRWLATATLEAEHGHGGGTAPTYTPPGGEPQPLNEEQEA